MASPAEPRFSPKITPINGQRGLLLVGHGTRDPRGLAEFGMVAELIAQQASEFVVESCFLELAEPNIATGVGELLERGIKRIVVAPLLLFAAGHAKRDIPAAVEAEIRVQGSGFSSNVATIGHSDAAKLSIVQQCPALECHPKIVDLSQKRYEEAIDGRMRVDAKDTLLILVGRGSSEASAIAEMRRFAAIRASQTPVASVEVCFVAVAVPQLGDALAQAERSTYQRIVVQPHLLFVGQVLDEIAAAVNEIAAVSREKEWIVAPHLGPSPLVAKAVLELARRQC